MLPIHFALLKQMLKEFGYSVELLESKGMEVAQTGLKYVHNDTCYPATLVIGQLMDAVLSGKYDTHKIALVISQTGCVSSPLKLNESTGIYESPAFFNAFLSKNK